jgi:hypothetical protein
MTKMQRDDGMAEHGVLRIPLKMIDPRNRSVMAILSQFQVTTYNKSLIAPSDVPKTWEDILKPAFKGRQFATEVRPLEIAALVPAWGIDKTLDFARRVAAQDPIWTGGASRTIAAVGVGEIPLVLGTNYSSTKILKNHIPGNPTILPEFMPGGGGKKAANYVHKSARPDGLTIGIMSSGFLPAALLRESGVLYDIEKTIYLDGQRFMHHMFSFPGKNLLSAP